MGKIWHGCGAGLLRGVLNIEKAGAKAKDELWAMHGLLG
jgi:hypothetical protein